MVMISVLVLLGLGLVTATVLAVASRVFHVEEDPRVQAVLEALPGANCGGCGYAGCEGYATAVATDPAFRGRGLASRLMREAMQVIAERGDDAAFLIPTPGKEWLREFYGRFGFAGDVPTEFISADRFDFGTGDAAADRAMVWRRTPEGPLPEQLTATWHS